MTLGPRSDEQPNDEEQPQAKRPTVDAETIMDLDVAADAKFKLEDVKGGRATAPFPTGGTCGG